MTEIPVVRIGDGVDIPILGSAQITWICGWCTGRRAVAGPRSGGIVP